MSKQTKLSPKFKRPSFTLIIATVSFVGMVLTAFVLGTYIYAQQETDDHNAQEFFKQTMRLTRLEVCYENNIHPCTQETINKFYDSQP